MSSDCAILLNLVMKSKFIITLIAFVVTTTKDSLELKIVENLGSSMKRKKEILDFMRIPYEKAVFIITHSLFRVTICVSLRGKGKILVL